jgi:hypothetical protein
MESLARGVRFTAGGVIANFLRRNDIGAIPLWTWKFLQWLFEVIAAAFTCLFLMWFVFPESSSAEKKRRDLDWLRRKTADEEWLHRRDADYQRELEEEDRWRLRQDPFYRRAARQANTPFSGGEINRLKRELSDMKPNGPLDAQFAKDGDRYLDNAQHYRSEALGAYRRRITDEE